MKPFESVMHDLIQPLIDHRISHVKFDKEEENMQGILHKTPTEYLTDYRLSIAGMLLTTTKRTLTDISESCGFSSPSYFGKIFKARYGVSPKKYACEAVQR